MNSEEHRRGSGGMSAGRRILGPRPVVMTVAAVCVLGVVLVLAQLVALVPAGIAHRGRAAFRQRRRACAASSRPRCSPPRVRRCALPRASCAEHRTALDASPSRHTSATRPSSRQNGDVHRVSSGAPPRRRPAARRAPRLRAPGADSGARGSRNRACRRRARRVGTIDWALRSAPRRAPRARRGRSRCRRSRPS